MRTSIIVFFLLIGTNVFCQPKVHTKVSVSIDTLGSSWLVCAHDSTFGLEGYGINSVILMDVCDCVDPYRYAYFDSHIDQDTSYVNQFTIYPPVTDICFKVSVLNSSDSAYAPIFISDSLGYYALVELHYYPRVNKTPETKNEPIPFTILPNPASGNSLNISLPEINQDAVIIVYDILGREELREKIPPGILQAKLSITNLKNGIYHAHLVSAYFQAMQKFEIVR